MREKESKGKKGKGQAQVSCERGSQDGAGFARLPVTPQGRSAEGASMERLSPVPSPQA